MGDASRVPPMLCSVLPVKSQLELSFRGGDGEVCESSSPPITSTSLSSLGIDCPGEQLLMRSDVLCPSEHDEPVVVLPSFEMPCLLTGLKAEVRCMFEGNGLPLLRWPSASANGCPRSQNAGFSVE